MSLYMATGKEFARIAKEASIIRNLDMSERWRGLFFDLIMSRGFRSVHGYEEQMVEIAKNETEVVLLLAEGKIVGIDTLHIVATQMGPNCQVDYYKSIKEKGVKNAESVSILERCTEGRETLSLLDFV